MFADDSLLLLEVDERSAEHLQYVISLYEDFSGQTINKEKSSIMFRHNTKQAEKVVTMDALAIGAEARNERYLGLPVYMGKSKEKKFSYLKDRIWKRIQGWKEKLLSKAGKEILIKAVVQAIPSYAMSCFDITKSLCDAITTMICRFWWTQQENENKMHGLSRETLLREEG